MNNKRLPVLEDFYNYRYLSTPEYCLQKDWLSYVISYADKERKIYVSEVLIKDLKTKEVFKISAGGTKEYNPRFNEDGSKMIFLSNVSGTDQIWIKDFNSGEVKKLTNMRYGVSDPQISPEGNKIAFLSAAPSDEKEELLQVEFTEEERKLHSIKRKKEAIEITDFGYKKEDDMGFATPEGNKKLWIINVGDDKAVCLTDGDRNHVMPVWSPDGSYILIVSNRARSMAEFLGLDLFKVDPNTKEITRLTDSVYTAYYPKKIVPRYTPNGKYIVGSCKIDL